MFSHFFVGYEAKIDYFQGLTSSSYNYFKLTYRIITKKPLNALSSYLLIFSTLLPSYNAQELSLPKRNYIAHDDGSVIDQFVMANHWVQKIEIDLKEKFEIISNSPNITSSRIYVFANHHGIFEHQQDLAVFARKLSVKNDYLLLEAVSAKTNLPCKVGDKEEKSLISSAKKIFTNMDISGWENCKLYKKSGKNIATRAALTNSGVLINEWIEALKPENINNKKLFRKILSKVLVSLKNIRHVELEESIIRVKDIINSFKIKDKTQSPITQLKTSTATIEYIAQKIIEINKIEENIFNNITLKERNKKGLINKLENLKNSKKRIFVSLGFMHVIPNLSWENKQPLDSYQLSDPQSELREYLKNTNTTILIPKMRK